MPKKALIFEGQVIQVESKTFPVAPPLQWIACPPETQPGMAVVDGQVVLPAPETAADALVAALAELSAHRRGVEMRGVGVGGVPYGTDIQTRLAMMSYALEARAAQANNQPYSVNWSSDIGWVVLSGADIIAAAQAITDHVRAAFDAERQHAMALAALTTAQDIRAYDYTTGWP